MTTLIHCGYNPNRELPIVTKIKSDVAKFNDKQMIISKLKTIEKQLMFQFDKQRFIWQQQELITNKEEQNNKIKSPETMRKFQQEFNKFKQHENTTSAQTTRNSSSFLAKLVE